MINVDLSRVSVKCKKAIKAMKLKVANIDKMINDKTGEGSDFLGWTNYPDTLSQAEINRIKKCF